VKLFPKNSTHTACVAVQFRKSLTSPEVFELRRTIAENEVAPPVKRKWLLGDLSKLLASWETS